MNKINLTKEELTAALQARGLPTPVITTVIINGIAANTIWITENVYVAHDEEQTTVDTVLSPGEEDEEWIVPSEPQATLEGTVETIRDAMATLDIYERMTAATWGADFCKTQPEWLALDETRRARMIALMHDLLGTTIYRSSDS